MTVADWLEICDNIDDGEHDDGLDQIAKAINSRREVVARRNARRLMRELRPKDRVIIHDATPRYLNDMVGTVKEIRDGATVVILDDVPSGRGRPPAEGRQHKVIVPLEYITKLDPEDARALPAEKMPAKDEIGDDEEYEELEDEDDDD